MVAGEAAAARGTLASFRKLYAVFQLMDQDCALGLKLGDRSVESGHRVAPVDDSSRVVEAFVDSAAIVHVGDGWPEMIARVAVDAAALLASMVHTLDPLLLLQRGVRESGPARSGRAPPAQRPFRCRMSQNIECEGNS